jgi:hypothetical protein
MQRQAQDAAKVVKLREEVTWA